jgi:hypothetical protein
MNQNATAASWHLLPPDLLELQIGQIDLLKAMYLEDFVLDQASDEVLDTLRDSCNYSISCQKNIVPIVARVLNLRINIDDESPNHWKLTLTLTVPFGYEGDEVPQEPPEINVRVQQPPWLSRAATLQLMANIPAGEDLLSVIEHIKEAAAQQLKESQLTANTPSGSDRAATDTSSLIRVWFYFPSISTRSKRDDFIIHAPSYSLTGFLYAGKPGLLCVEGTSQNIDDYMRFIKTESWGDIPAHHKKVSERYRESGDKVERVFDSMTEITDSVGERRGQRANRGDMKALEEWLVERALGEAFTKVLM